MLSDNQNATFVAVKVEGRVVSRPMSDHLQANEFIKHLPENQRMLAEVVTVTRDGKEILLG